MVKFKSILSDILMLFKNTAKLKRYAPLVQVALISVHINEMMEAYKEELKKKENMEVDFYKSEDVSE